MAASSKFQALNPSPAARRWGLFLWALSLAPSSAATLELLGDLPGGNVRAVARGVSADGSVIVGSGESANGTAGFVWTAGNGMVQLPFLSGNQSARANSVSDDGSVIVGEARNLANRDQAVVWTRQSDGSYTIQALTPPSGSKFGNITEVNMEAHAVSGDGLTVVGQGRSTIAPAGATFEAFYWTSTAGVTPMGNLSGGPTVGDPPNEKGAFSSARGVDRTGSVAAGSSRSALRANSTAVNSEAFRYQFSNDTMTGLGDLQTPVFSSNAEAISKDGTTFTGQARAESGDQVAFRYTAVGGMENLGDLPTGSTVATGFGINEDGSVIVGRGQVEPDPNVTNNSLRAFVWTEGLGLQSLVTVAGLTTVELGTNGFLEEAWAVSDDGLIIVGAFADPTNDPVTPERQAFRLTLTPAELLLGGMPDPTAQELVDASDLSLSIDGSDKELSFQFREDLDFVYTLQYSPDLATTFADHVTFTPDGTGSFIRNVITTPDTGSALFTDPILTETLTSSSDRGFWRLKVTAP